MRSDVFSLQVGKEVARYASSAAFGASVFRRDEVVE
jgi:hypothetical protein